MNKAIIAGVVAGTAGLAVGQTSTVDVTLYEDAARTVVATTVDTTDTLFARVSITSSVNVGSFEFGLQGTQGTVSNWAYDPTTAVQFDAFGIALFPPALSGSSIDNIGGAVGFGDPGTPDFVVGDFEVSGLSVGTVSFDNLTNGGFPAAAIAGVGAIATTERITGNTMNVVPTPGAAAILGLGGLAAARRRRA